MVAGGGGGSPVDQIDEVLNHPQGCALHLCQQEPVDHPVGVPVGDTAPPVTLCGQERRLLAASDLVLLRDALVIHPPVVELPEATPWDDDRMGGVYLRVELWVVLHIGTDLKKRGK